MSNKPTLAKQLHDWYLEATRLLDPTSYNPNAQKEYDLLTDEQKMIDEFIANKVNQLIAEIHKHAWSLAKYWEPSSYENDNEWEPKAVFKSVWLCECGSWKTAWHTGESYWNDQRSGVSKELTND